MAHEIKIELSAVGQRAALLAGEPAQQHQTYELTAELLPRALTLGAIIYADGSATLATQYSYRILDARPGNALAAIEAFEAVEAARAATNAALRIERGAAEAVRDAKRAEARAAISATLAACSDERLAELWLADGKTMPVVARALTSALKIHWDHADLAEHRVAGVTSVATALVAAQEAEAERVQQARRVERRAVLVLSALPDQLERFDAGVLPGDELTALLEEHLFAAFADLPRYARLTGDDLEHEYDCGRDHKFKAEDVEITACTAQQWARLKALREIAVTIKDARVQVRKHTAYCTDECRACTASTVRLGARVEIEFAGDTYRVEFVL